MDKQWLVEGTYLVTRLYGNVLKTAFYENIWGGACAKQEMIRFGG